MMNGASPMGSTIERDSAYARSNDLVAREIQGVLVIVPVTSGIGDLEEELFTLNDTAKSIWDMLDGRRTVSEIVAELAAEYEVSPVELDSDIVGLLEELVKRKLVVLA
jgi:hypothetical protein